MAEPIAQPEVSPISLNKEQLNWQEEYRESQNNQSLAEYVGQLTSGAEKHNFILYNSGRNILSTALDRGDVDGVLACLQILEDFCGKGYNAEKRSMDIEFDIAKFASTLKEYHDDDLSRNILQKALNLALGKSGQGFSDRLPKRILSCVQAVGDLGDRKIVGNLIIETDRNADSALHITASHRCTGPLFMMMLDLLSDEDRKHIHTPNAQQLTPLMLLIKHKTTGARSISKIVGTQLIPSLTWGTDGVNILEIANNSGQDYLLETIKKLYNVEIEIFHKETLKLIITNDRCDVMSFIVEDFKATLQAWLKNPDFHLQLRYFTLTIRMRDKILDALATEEEKLNLSGLITSSSDQSRMHAIVFCNDENESQCNAEKLSKTLESLHFTVHAWYHNQWNKDTLCVKLQSILDQISAHCSKLLVVGISHGYHRQIVDAKWKKIALRDIESTLNESPLSRYTLKTFVADMCQTYDSDADGENAEAQMEEDETQVVTMVACSPGEKSYGDVLIPRLCEELEKREYRRTKTETEIDLYQVFVNIMKDIEEKYGGLENHDKPIRGPQNPEVHNLRHPSGRERTCILASKETKSNSIDQDTNGLS